MITKNEILKLGDLAKIGISENEVKELEEQLNKILNFVNKINENTSVKKQNLMSTHSEHNCTLRLDEVTDISDEKNVLKNSPSSSESLITVPLVIK